MARPMKATVDYFPCDAVFSDSIRCIKSEFGNDGELFWFRLLQAFCRHEYHFIDLRESNLKRCLFYSEEMGFPVETCNKILARLAQYGSINNELFQKNIIVSGKFIERISDAYKKRIIKPIGIEEIKKMVFDTIKVEETIVSGEKNEFPNEETRVSDVRNPQTKLNKTKLNKSKLNETHTKENESCVCGSSLLSESKLDILRKYAKKTARNVDAYVKSLVKNGGYVAILEQDKKKNLLQEAKRQEEWGKICPLVINTPEEEEHIKEVQRNLKSNLTKLVFQKEI